MKKKATRDPIKRSTTEALHARSGGSCEARAVTNCSGRGEHRHHRKLRRWGDHSLANMLHVCHRCHEWLHRNPERSYALGLLVRAEDDPATVPVIHLH